MENIVNFEILKDSEKINIYLKKNGIEYNSDNEENKYNFIDYVLTKFKKKIKKRSKIRKKLLSIN